MGWLFNRCSHSRILAHTYAQYADRNTNIITKCLDECGKTLKFPMGMVAKESRDALARIVLQEYGYVLDDSEPGEVWKKVDQ